MNPSLFLMVAVLLMLAGPVWAQTTQAPPFISALQVTYLVAGLIGGALKAAITNTQETISKRSLVDVVIGGLAAVLIPQFFPNLVPSGTNLFGQGVVVVLISYASSDFVQGILARLGVQAQGGVVPPKP